MAVNASRTVTLQQLFRTRLHTKLGFAVKRVDTFDDV